MYTFRFENKRVQRPRFLVSSLSPSLFLFIFISSRPLRFSRSEPRQTFSRSLVDSINVSSYCSPSERDLGQQIDATRSRVATVSAFKSVDINFPSDFYVRSCLLGPVSKRKYSLDLIIRLFSSAFVSVAFFDIVLFVLVFLAISIIFSPFFDFLYLYIWRFTVSKICKTEREVFSILELGYN